MMLRGRRLRVAVVLLIFSGTFVTLEVVAHRQKSGTWDEPMHLAAGYAALSARDYLVDPSHPPLLRIWASLPLLAMRDVALDDAVLSRTSTPGWSGEAYEFARRFVYVDNDADRLLEASRNMIVVWGVVLGLLIFAWTYEWLGFVPAILALAFYTVEPNLAAHASLVTTDFGITCLVFGTIYFLWRTCRRASAFNVAGLAGFFALALVSKFSGLILLPLVTVLVAWAVLGPPRIARRTAAVIAVLLLVTGYTAIWAAYGFQYAPHRGEERLLRVDTSATARQDAPALAAALGWLDAHRLLPNAFSQGLLYSQVTAGRLPAYLAGDYSQDGWWYYFPAAFLLKTPAPLTALMAAGLFACVRWRSRLGTESQPYLVVPVAVFFAAAMTSDINVGLRHILPVYPFLLVLAAAGAAWLLAEARVAGRVMVAALTASAAIGFAAVYPDTLTFFTWLVGGPSKGSKYLADSNLDWGQHLKALKQWTDDHGVSHINLAYFGTADPAYYGIECTHLPGAPTFAVDDIARPRLPGYVAISATVASGVYLDPRWRLFYRGFRDRVPVAEIGHSIRVYWLDTWPEPAEAASGSDVGVHADLADALLFGMQWPEHAAAHYRTYIRHRPDDAEAMGRLGLALLSLGASGEAIERLQRAVALAPGNARPRRTLAEALVNAGRADEAAPHAERAVALSPDDPAAHDVLGVTLVLRGRFVEARQQFEHALAVAPGYQPAREHLDRINAILAVDARGRIVGSP